MIPHNQTLAETMQLVKLMDKCIESYTDYSIGVEKDILDYEYVKRTLIERLFTTPWQPLKATKRIYKPCMYLYPANREIAVSPRTYEFFLMATDNTGVTRA